MVHSKEKERTTDSTANHLLTTLRRMLNLAVKWGLLEKIPQIFRKSLRKVRCGSAMKWQGWAGGSTFPGYSNDGPIPVMGFFLFP
jgi:hypothetical protein